MSRSLGRCLRQQLGLQIYLVLLCTSAQNGKHRHRGHPGKVQVSDWRNSGWTQLLYLLHELRGMGAGSAAAVMSEQGQSHQGWQKCA